MIFKASHVNEQENANIRWSTSLDYQKIQAFTKGGKVLKQNEISSNFGSYKVFMWSLKTLMAHKKVWKAHKKSSKSPRKGFGAGWLTGSSGPLRPGSVHARGSTNLGCLTRTGSTAGRPTRSGSTAGRKGSCARVVEPVVVWSRWGWYASSKLTITPPIQLKMTWNHFHWKANSIYYIFPKS